ncbi:MAG: TldD/PmbA family protein [Desulfarculus sp.]|nr:TldD/PmbA family protein [Desulfarculus sp.]
MASQALADLTRVAEQALVAAKQAGAQEASANVTRSRFVDVGFRDGGLEKASSSIRQGLTVRLFLDGRYALHSTSDLRPEALAGFMDKAAALTRLLEPDPQRSLAEPARYARGPAPDLGLMDQTLRQSPTALWMDLGREMEGLSRAAGQRAGQLVSAQGGSYMEVSQDVLATSYGFLGSQEETGGFVVASTVLMDPGQGGKRRSGHWWRGSHRLAGLGGGEQLTALASTAAARALRQMGARPGPSGPFPVLVENQAASRLLGDLLGCLSGATLHQERSYLRGRQGQAVAAPLLTINDQPLLQEGFGSRWYDGEGVAAQAFNLVEGGVLRDFYLDTYYARMLGLKPTTGGHSNVILAPSQPGGFAEMLAGLERGLAVTSFLGGNFNSTTGDFSYGLQGLWVEGGQVAHAVEGMNMAGNFDGLWRSLQRVGDDPFPYTKLRTPSLLFGELRLSGASLAPGASAQ